MSNPDRKLVTVKHIDRIEQHPNADRLELAYVGGWQCVVAKGEFSVGQLVLYFEPDSFIDVSDPRFEFLKERGVKTMRIGHKDVDGHVLRTIKLRGEFSQGLVLDAAETLGASKETIAELCAAKVNLAKSLGVVEYEPPNTTGRSSFIGRYDNYVAPRTDCERVQNIEQDVWDALKKSEYFVSVKCDGTSITMCTDTRDGEFKMYSHNNRFDLENPEGIGKTAYDTAVKQGLVELCDKNPGITIQAELCGPKIGGNRLRLKEYRLFVFSIYDMDLRLYYDPYQYFWDFTSAELHQWLTPKVNVNLSDFATTLDFIEHVDGLRGSITKDALDEGLVIHVVGHGDCSDAEWALLQRDLHPHMQVKTLSRAYLAKAK